MARPARPRAQRRVFRPLAARLHRRPALPVDARPAISPKGPALPALGSLRTTCTLASAWSRGF
jgi:hypothetical protein